MQYVQEQGGLDRVRRLYSSTIPCALGLGILFFATGGLGVLVPSINGLHESEFALFRLFCGTAVAAFVSGVIAFSILLADKKVQWWWVPIAAIAACCGMNYVLDQDPILAALNWQATSFQFESWAPRTENSGLHWLGNHEYIFQEHGKLYFGGA